ncbi:MAG TPA: hypothetical protein VES01_01970 [Dermatophilaceae bacterium]|nr:hypothetical protein [Dermatophilaceae bacterium]
MLELFFWAIWKVVVTSLVIGAGLPALFAYGVRAMASGAGGDADAEHAPGHPFGRVVAYVCFAVVLAGVALGITVIVAAACGRSAGFQGIVPTLVTKGG